MSYNTILLIDDDDDDQEIFLSAISELNIPVDCKTCSSAKDALNKLMTAEIAPELIFLDLNMPAMNGQQFLLEIKKVEQLRNIPIIIYSTTSHQSTKDEMKKLGAYNFLTKPDKISDLVSSLRTILK